MITFRCKICGRGGLKSRASAVGHANRKHSGRQNFQEEDDSGGDSEGDPGGAKPRPKTMRDILLALLSEHEIPAEVRLKYALEILALTE